MVFARPLGGGGNLSPSFPKYGSLTHLPYDLNDPAQIQNLPYDLSNPVHPVLLGGGTRGFSPWLSPAAAGVGNHATYPMPDLGLSPNQDLLDELLDKRENILDDIPIVPDFDTLMGRWREERAQLPTYEEVAAKRSPAAQAFHDKYSNKLDSMFNKYGFERMAPGSLAAAKAGFLARKNAFEDIQQAEVDRNMAIIDAREEWKEEKSDILEEWHKKQDEKEQDVKNFLNNIFADQTGPGGFNSNLSPRAAYGKEGAPFVVPSDEYMKKHFGEAPENNDSENDDDDTGFLGDLLDSVTGIFENAKEGTTTAIQALNPFDDVSMNEAITDYAKDTADNEGVQKAQVLGDALGDSLTLGLTNLIPGSEEREKAVQQSLQAKNEDTGGLDLFGQALGFLVPGLGAVKAAKAIGLGAKSLKGLSKGRKLAEMAKEGAASGAIFDAALEGSQELQDADDESFGDHLWDVAKGAALGAALDPAMHGLASKIGGLWTRWRAGDVPLEKAKVELKDMVTQERQKLPDLNIDENTPFNTLAKPANFDSLLGDLGTRRTTFQSPDVSFNTVKRESPQMQEIDATLDDLRTQYQELRDADVESKLMPILEKEFEWQALKELDDEYVRIRSNGKITIPEANRSDWADEVPLVFRAGKNNKTSIDLYEAADTYGFETVDNFVDYLNKLDEAHKIVTGNKGNFLGLAPEHRGRIESLEKQLKQEFKQSDDAQGLTSLAENLKKERAKLKPELSVETKATQPVMEDLGDLLGFSNPKVRTSKEQIDPGQPQSDNLDDAFNFMGAKTKNPSNAEGSVKRFGNKALQHLSDSRTYLRKKENMLRGKKRYRDDPDSLYIGITNADGAVAAAENYVKEDIIPLAEAVRKAGYNVSDALRYKYAKHFIELKRRDPDYKLPNNVDIEAFRQFYQKNKGNPVYESFSKGIDRYMDDMLSLAVKSGLIDAEQKKALQTAYKDYMPKFREQDLQDADGFEEAFGGFLSIKKNAKKGIEKLKEGGGGKLADPMENIMAYTQGIVRNAMRNKAMQNLAELAEVPLNQKYKFVKEVGGPSEGNNVFTVKFGGDERYFNVDDDIAEALSVVSDAEIPSNIVTKSLETLGKYQRTSITFNPSFLLKSIVKDYPQAVINSDKGLRLIMNTPVTILDLLSNGKFVKKSILNDYYRDGAGQNTIWAQDRHVHADMQKKAYGKEARKGFKTLKSASDTKKAVSQWLDWLRKVSEVTEQLPKAAEYRATLQVEPKRIQKQLKKGKIDQKEADRQLGNVQSKAAFNAADIADFRRSGQSVKNINRIAAFINSNIQGKSKFVRSMIQHPASTMTKSAIPIGLMSVLAHTLYKTAASETQKNLYEEAEGWRRDTYWLLPSPFNEGELIQIPKPWEAAALVASPVEYMLRKHDGQDLDFTKEFLRWAKTNLIIDPTLTPITPLVEAGFNKDLFTGREIVDDTKKPIEQQDVFTSQVAKGLASIMNKIPVVNTTGAASPKMIQHLIEGYLPVSGEVGLDVIDRALEKSGVTENVKPKGAVENPLYDVLGQFTVKSEGNTSDLLGDLYDTQLAFQNARRKLEETDAKKYKYPSIYSVLNKAEDRANELASKMDDIVNNPDYSAEQKEAFRNRLIEKRNELVRDMAERGFFSSDSKVLAQLEQHLKKRVDLDQNQIFTPEANDQVSLAKKLLEAGISKSQVKEIINADVSEDEKKRMILGLLQNR